MNNKKLSVKVKARKRHWLSFQEEMMDKNVEYGVYRKENSMIRISISNGAGLRGVKTRDDKSA